MKLERVTPGGIRFSIDTSQAIYRLEMAKEDDHSSRVFTNYASALRYAREQKLPTIPSASLVLSTCRAGDLRLQAALELALDAEGQTGRPALLRRWMEAVLAQRELAAPVDRPAYDGAVSYLATAIALGGGKPELPPGSRPVVTIAAVALNDPPLGPWATAPELTAIWHRDRFLSRGVEVTDSASAATAAVLARTLAADVTLKAGWQQQLAVSQVLNGKTPGLTFDSLSVALAGVANSEITGATVISIVRSAVAASAAAGHQTNPAPAAVAWVMTPEEQVLLPLQMKAWNDPVGALIAAIRSGAISLEPGPDAGFYRRRWFALEALAAPARAPETGKLQLSADYMRRWQRAFAAGFTEGRSGFVKRLPEFTLGGEFGGDVPVEVAPQFTAEPAPVVYLRLARAYRALGRELSSTLGEEPWRQLQDAHGNYVAADVNHRAKGLFGLAMKVYREVGYPPPLLEEERGLDAAAAEAAAEAWCASLETNPDAKLDARLLVTLADNGMGLHRCPAILGVRFEPVRFDWVEEPEVDGDFNPRFVPAHYWLASPCPVTLTVRDIPTPEAFRRSCDGHETVASLYGAFGQQPPQLHSPGRKWWLWVTLGVTLFGLGFVAVKWWRHQDPQPRRFIKVGMAVGVAGAIVIAIVTPPNWLLKLVLVRVITAHENFACAGQELFVKWAGERRVPLALKLMADPDPQVRYLGTWLHPAYPISSRGDEARRYEFTPTQMAFLREKVSDEVPEVGWEAWAILCQSEPEIPFLVQQLDQSVAPNDLKMRLAYLSQWPANSDVMGAVIKLALHRDEDIRAIAVTRLSMWKEPAPLIVAELREFTSDTVPKVRERAATGVGQLGGADDLGLLLGLWKDSSQGVRIAAFKAVGARADDSEAVNPKPFSRTSWTNETIQRSLASYVSDKAVTLEERLCAGRWIASPATLRASCRELLPAVEQLPAFTGSYTDHSGCYESEWTREVALARLATRWALADNYVKAESENWYEDDSYLMRYPELLNALVNCIRSEAGTPGVLEVLRAALSKPEERSCALDFIRRLGLPAAPLTETVQELHSKSAGDTRWECVRALVEMGPEAEMQIRPWLEQMKADPSNGWRAEGFLENISEPATGVPIRR